MTSLLVHDAPWGTLLATGEGARFTFRESGPPPDGDLTADLCILLEQGFAAQEPDGVLVPWDRWGLAVWYKVRALTAFTQPSHLLLKIDRVGEIGRDNFAYVVQWMEGAREVAIERTGAYLRHAASGRLMHLDGHTLALVDAMERFNAMDPSSRRGPRAAWEVLATVHREAAANGALLDQHLRENTVVIPSSIGLTVHEDEAGALTFLPRVDGVEASTFVAQFDRSMTVPEVYSLTGAGGRRVRILFSEEQREVLRRMKQVSRLRGDVARHLREQPVVSVFDGIADAVDLSDVQMTYGPRVTGVGGGKLPTMARLTPRTTLTDVLGVRRPDTELPYPTDQEAEAPLKLVQAVALDVIDARTGAPLTLRLTEPAVVAALYAVVTEALDRGDTEATHGEYRIVVEEALRSALARYLEPSDIRGAGPDADGELGRTGHLYLLINEHEETITEALRVDPAPPEAVPVVTAQVPEALHPDVGLQPHQLEGIQWLRACSVMASRRGAVLADDMGLGKTLQLLAFVASLIECGELLDAPDAGPNGPWRPVLIVAPLLLVETGTWLEEMQRRFSDDGRIFEPYLILRGDGLRLVTRAGGGRDLLGKPLLDPAKLMAHKVIITSYETMTAYQHSLAQLIEDRPIWSLVIFDEAQEIKAPKAKQSIAAKAVAARFKVATTGTPVETRLLDLWNLMDNVEPGLLDTQRDFVARYERPAMNAPSAAVREQVLTSLRARLRYQQPGAMLLRRDKSVLRALPPRNEHRMSCEVTSTEREVLRGLLAGNRRGGKGSALALLQRLHLASQHPVLSGGPGDPHDVDGLLRDSSRLQALIDVLREVETVGEKALIFARSVDAQRLLAHVVGRVFGRTVDVINGSTGTDGGQARSAGAARRQILDRFRSAPGFGVIVLSPFVAGVGLTLTEANHVVHYGRWWNPAIESQATDRVYRIGQQRPVHVYYPISVDSTGEFMQTLDQAIDALLTERRALAGDFLAPVGEDAAASLLFRRVVNAGAGVTVDEAAASDGAPASMTVQCPTNVAHVAGLLAAMSGRDGTAFVWLGSEGLYGAHALMRSCDGILVCVRIVEAIGPDDATILSAAERTWSAHASAPPTSVLLIGGREDGSEGVTRKTWQQVADEAAAGGVPDAARWTVLLVHNTVPDALHALTRGVPTSR
jgi:hypothetical protein